MHTYDFVSKNISQQDVENTIGKAGYTKTGYTYTQRVDRDGFVVKGNDVMSLTKLRNAATELKLKVEISSPLSLMLADDESTPYSLVVNVDGATLADLKKGFKLVGFKGVKAPNGAPDGSAPLAWFTTTTIGLSTTISWEESYSAYTSQQQVVPQGVISAVNPAPIAIGQTYQIDDSGTGPVIGSGQSNAISIHNMGNTPFACGISQEVTTPDGTSVQQLCAFPLYGGGLDVIIPEEKVFLMFTNGPVETGQVFEQTYTRGLLVDLTGVSARDGIKFDINTGWDWGGYNWAHQYEAQSSLAPLLIDSSASAQTTRAVKLARAA